MDGPGDGDSDEMELSGHDSDDYEVMSEVHLGCPPSHPSLFVSRYTFLCPTTSGTNPNCSEEAGKVITIDKEGDLDLPRRNSDCPKFSSLVIQHKITSSIPQVGLQVWKAAVLLVDFILHGSFTSREFNDVIAVELGAGTGLVGLALAPFAKTVFLTDCGVEILDNCLFNAEINSELIEHKNSVLVRELDWEKSWPPVVGHSLPCEPRLSYSWDASEIDIAEQASLLLAADVIYSDKLTDSFFNTLEQLMSQGCEKVLYLSLEKRYNFCLDDLAVVANGYSNFRRHLKNGEDCSMVDPSNFIGRNIDINNIPQYIREYERGQDLEIWEIRYVGPKRNGQVVMPNPNGKSGS